MSAGRERFQQDAVLQAGSEDGHRFEIWTYDKGVADSAPLLLFLPAMGTRASNYKLLTGEMRARGYAGALCDLRGHGSSSQKAGPRCNFGYKQMLLDIRAAILTIRRRHPNRTIYLAGHSLGGQLSLLYAAANHQAVAGVILIASCSVYWRGFGMRAIPFRLILSFVRPLVSHLGYFPGHRLGFARQEGAQVMKDWAHQGITGRYELADDHTPYEQLLGEMSHPVLVLEASGDQFAPPTAVSHLIGKLSVSEISRQSFDVLEAQAGREHFDWFKAPAVVADKIHDWLSGHHGAEPH